MDGSPNRLAALQYFDRNLPSAVSFERLLGVLMSSNLKLASRAQEQCR